MFLFLLFGGPTTVVPAPVVPESGAAVVPGPGAAVVPASGATVVPPSTAPPGVEK